MSPDLIQMPVPITILGAGPIKERNLRDALAVAPDVVGVDGGTEMALKYGIMPIAVLGDFDSVDPAALAALPPDRVHHIAEQYSTDFDKALRSIDAPLLLALGFLGGRTDHLLGVLSSLLRQPAKRCLLIGKRDVVFHLSAQAELDLWPGARVSLFPLRQVTAEASGLHWPLEGITFAPGGDIGVSNKATRSKVLIHPHGDGLICILPRKAMGAAIAALLAMPRG